MSLNHLDDELLLRQHFDMFRNSTDVVQRQDEQDEGKTKQRLSYETFVQHLEEGDPFTTSLIEILVKVRETRAACMRHSYPFPCRSWQTAKRVRVPLSDTM